MRYKHPTTFAVVGYYVTSGDNPEHLTMASGIASYDNANSIARQWAAQDHGPDMYAVVVVQDGRRRIVDRYYV